MKIEALFFDQDGVIVDTERDGHRLAFNRTFKEFGIDTEWDVGTYHKLLQIAGGKERMRHYFEEAGFGRDVDDTDELIANLHKRKTEVFIELIESGALPLRPGVLRLMREARQAGIPVAICTTSNERAAAAIADVLLAEIDFEFVIAGDQVSKKKPDPEIYLKAIERNGVRSGNAFAIEDSHNGVTAAKAAGLRVVATTNPYTEQEDLSQADVILDGLGDPGGELSHMVRGPAGFDFTGVLSLSDLYTIIELS